MHVHDPGRAEHCEPIEGGPSGVAVDQDDGPGHVGVAAPGRTGSIDLPGQHEALARARLERGNVTDVPTVDQVGLQSGGGSRERVGDRVG